MTPEVDQMPKWILRECACGGLHRSRWHAAVAHGQKSVPRRWRRFTKVTAEQERERRRG